MKHVAWLTTFLFAASLLLVPPVTAGDWDHDRKREVKKEKWLYKLAKKKLDLSQDQKTELGELYFEWSMERIDLKAQKKKYHLRLKRLLHTNAGQSEVESRIDALYRAKAEIKKADMNFKFAIRDVLGDEQWHKLREKMKYLHRMKKKKRHYKRMKGHHHDRDHWKKKCPGGDDDRDWHHDRDD